MKYVLTDELHPYKSYRSSSSVCDKSIGSQISQKNQENVYLRLNRTNNHNNHRPVTLSPPPNRYLSQQWKTNTKGTKGSTKPKKHKKRPIEKATETILKE